MKRKNMSRIQSFRHAFHGIAELMKSEINFRIELVMGIIALGMCGFFQVTAMEWCIILLCCVLVLALEGINTSVEKTVDLVTEEYRELARVAKDVAAGAVLMTAIGAACVGAIVFYPYIMLFINR